MLEQDPRVSEGPTFFQSLYGWMKRVAVEVNNALRDLSGKVNRSGDTMTGGLNLVSPSTSATEANTNNSTRIATTAWVRNAMADIAAVAGFASSFGTNSYVKFPSWLGGFVVQFGFHAPGGGGSTTITFPLAFPTACHAGLATMVNSAPAANVNITCLIVSTAATNMVVMRRFANGGVTGDAGDPLLWAAFGR